MTSIVVQEQATALAPLGWVKPQAGTFRAAGENTLGADTDGQAVKAWLDKYERQPRTQRSYEKEAKRLLRWCAVVKGKPLSSLTGPDCAEYRAFLENIPPEWINPTPVPTTSPAWRPFRGPLSASSVKQALVILHGMFESLLKSGYLSANAMEYVNANVSRGSRVQIERRFSDAEWAFITISADSEPGARGRRIRLILDLLVTTGLRCEEMTQAVMSHVFMLDVEGTQIPILKVVGKGGKEREVVMDRAVFGLLQQHRQDRIDLGLLDANAQDCDIPLVGALKRVAANEDGNTAANGAITPNGLYVILKKFFARCMDKGLPAALDAKSFLKGSTHWLRHTAATRMVNQGVELDVVRRQLGHASLTTTSIYVNTELQASAKALYRVNLRTAG